MFKCLNCIDWKKTRSSRGGVLFGTGGSESSWKLRREEILCKLSGSRFESEGMRHDYRHQHSGKRGGYPGRGGEINRQRKGGEEFADESRSARRQKPPLRHKRK